MSLGTSHSPYQSRNHSGTSVALSPVLDVYHPLLRLYKALADVAVTADAVAAWKRNYCNSIPDHYYCWPQHADDSHSDSVAFVNCIEMVGAVAVGSYRHCHC